MIRLENVACGYNQKVVLKDISFTLEKGTFTCLLGKNGVGKTTLFKTILGLLPPLSGEILYRDVATSSLSAKAFAQLISYVPQAHGTPFPFSVLDVVTMGQFVHSSRRFQKPSLANVEVAMDAITTLGIEKLAHKTFSKISGGEKQMVLIARAMAQQPQYIAMDEPTSNLDMGNQVRVMEVTQLLAERGYGVIMNTHSPQQTLQYADEVIMLHDGGLLHKGKPQEVLHNRTLSDLYNTPMELVQATTSTGHKRDVLITL